MKLLDKYEDMSRIILAFRGWTKAVDILNREKNEFMLYKNNLIDVNKNQKKSFEILEILVNIGFPIDEMGTYLYKNLIEQINITIDNFGPEKIKETRLYLIEELSDKNSMFLTNLALNLNLSPLSFNRLIKYATTQVDLTKADDNLIKQIFNDRYEPAKYSPMAFYIVNYIRQKQKKEGYQKIK